MPFKLVKREERDKKEDSYGTISEWGINEKTVGSISFRMGYQVIPPKVRLKAHYHKNCETGIYVLKGRIRTYVGKDRRVYESGPGDFIYIPAGEIHQSENPSDTEPAEAIMAQNANTEESAEYVFEEGQE